MNKLLVSVLMLVFTVAGCGKYNAEPVALKVPKNQSYCQRLGDMAVGLEPYMVKEKTELKFDNDLRAEDIMALNISMIADGDREYIVKKSDIEAIDEFGNKYEPMEPAAVADRIDRALRSDEGLVDDITERDMPGQVTVSRELTQHFLFYDMQPSNNTARKFTVSVKAESADGTSQKAFRITVDPFRGHMNPTERWNSYDERGVTPCGELAMKKAAPAPEPEPMKVEETPKAEGTEETEKQERMFEKGLEK